MPRRATLTEARRRKLVGELKLYAELEKQAALDKYVHVYLSNVAGMSLREIAEVYEVSRDTAQRWKDAGEREHRERTRDRSADPERPGEPEPIG